MTLPNEQVARYGPGDNLPVYADPAAIEAGRFVKITGKNAAGGYIGRHCTAGERASGVSERKVPVVPTAGARAPERHSTNLNRLGAVAFVEAGAVVSVGDLVGSDATGRAITADGDGTNATLATGTVGANNAITWTARDGGSDGNEITVAIIDPAGNNGSLAVDVDGSDIIVTGATDGASALSSTAAEVMTAINEHDTASQLVTVDDTGASTGAGIVVAVAETALAGGAPGLGLGSGVNGEALTAAAAAGDYIEVDRF